MSVFAACSNNNDNILPDTEEQSNNKFKFHLDVKQTEKNIFERMEFELSPNDGYSINNLHANYDSIEWHVETKGKIKIFELGHTIYTWSHNFFLPGTFDTFLVGYKDDNTFYSDTTAIKITNDKEFLAYNWSDIKGSIGKAEGYVNLLEWNQYSFVNYQDIHGGVPSVKFYHFNEYETNDKILLEYISALYSKPDYTLENKDVLMEEYNELFHYKKENASPTNIWITSASKIVLLKCCDEDYCYYEVYAEPN